MSKESTKDKMNSKDQSDWKTKSSWTGMKDKPTEIKHVFSLENLLMI